MEESVRLRSASTTKDDFNSILLSIGGFGNQQKILFITQCTLCLFYAFLMFGPLFMALTPPDHWCAVDSGTRTLLQTKMAQDLLYTDTPTVDTIGPSIISQSPKSAFRIATQPLQMNPISSPSHSPIPSISKKFPTASGKVFEQPEEWVYPVYEESRRDLKGNLVGKKFGPQSSEKHEFDFKDDVLEGKLTVHDGNEIDQLNIIAPGLLEASKLEQYLRHITIPRTEEGDDYEHCVMYDVNWPEVVSRGAMLSPNSSWPTKPCSDGWHYDYSLYYPTITSELSWVCQHAPHIPLAQAMFFVGSVVGGPLFGWLADARGRRIALISSNFLTGLAGVAAALSPNLALFCLTLFVLGFNAYPQINISYILVMEFVTPEHRGLVATVPFMVFMTLGLTALPWLAYFTANWRILGGLLYAPLLTTPLLWWFIPESVRWQLGKGHHKMALRTLEGVARLNGVEMTEKLTEKLKVFVSSNQVASAVPVWHLLRTPRLRKHFFSLCVLLICIRLLYDAHVRITQSLRLNLFVTFSASSAVEVLAGLAAYLLADRLGRRSTTVVMLLLAAAGEVASAVVDQDSHYLQLSLHVVCRLALSTAISMCFMLPVEVLPTVARSQAAGLIHTLGFAVALLSPYIAYLALGCRPCALLLLGGVAVLGAVTCLLGLPETRGQDLPDTLEEGEDFCRGQRLLSWRKRQQREEGASRGGV